MRNPYSNKQEVQRRSDDNSDYDLATAKTQMGSLSTKYKKTT